MKKKSAAETVAELLSTAPRRRAGRAAPAPVAKRAGGATGRYRGVRAWEEAGRRVDQPYGPRVGRGRRLLLSRLEHGRWYTSREVADLCAPELTFSGAWQCLRKEVAAGRIERARLAEPVRVIGLMRRYAYRKVGEIPAHVPLRERYIAEHGEAAWAERERLRRLAHCKDWQKRNRDRMRELTRRMILRKRERLAAGRESV